MNRVFYYLHFKDEETKAQRLLVASPSLHSWYMLELGITHSQSDSEDCSNQDMRDILVPCSKLVTEAGSRLRLAFCTVSGPMQGVWERRRAFGTRLV